MTYRLGVSHEVLSDSFTLQKLSCLTSIMWNLLALIYYSWLLLYIVLAAVHQNGLSMNQMLMGLSPNVLPGPKEGDLAGHEGGHDSKRMHTEKGTELLYVPIVLLKRS